MSEDTRRCNRCGETKPLTLEYWRWNKAHSRWDGRVCKKCLSERTRLWQQENADRYTAYRVANRDRMRQLQQTWRDNNRDRIREYNRTWRTLNPEKMRAIRIRNLEKQRLAFRNWYAQNREASLARRRAQYQARRAAKKGDDAQ